MRFRRSAVAGLALLTSITLTVAGCGVRVVPAVGSGGSPTPSAQREKPPRDVLAASTAETERTTYKYTMTVGEGTAEGVADPTTGNGRIDLTFVSPEDRLKVTFNVLSMGDEAWLKVDLGRAASLPDAPKLPKQWMRLDKSKLKDADDVNFKRPDPIDATVVFGAIIEVRKAGERLYDGTVDLTKAKDAFMVDESHIKALGTGATTIPFSATVDDKGRLTSLEIKVPAAKDFEATTWKGSYLEYGAAVTLTKPQPGEVVPATADAYELFNQ
jgi:hypothetical protein